MTWAASPNRSMGPSSTSCCYTIRAVLLDHAESRDECTPLSTSPCDSRGPSSIAIGVLHCAPGQHDVERHRLRATTGCIGLRRAAKFCTRPLGSDRISDAVTPLATSTLASSSPVRCRCESQRDPDRRLTHSDETDSSLHAVIRE